MEPEGLQMNPAIRPLSFDPAKLRGLSERLLQSHHQNNYGGAVKRLHAIRAELAALDWTTAPGLRVNGLKRDFGSFERWSAEFTGLATTLGGGSGWALLSWSARENRLLNHWAADHTHLLAGATPILALDLYEHAYHMDFGADAKAYVAAFMENIDWDGVALRYAAAVEGSTAALAIGAEEIQNANSRRIDVRRKGAYDAAPEVIEGAVWRDPEKVDEWAGEWAGAEVVVYCVYGHEVGQSTAARLRDAGVSARFLSGGIEDWKTAGRPVRRKA